MSSPTVRSPGITTVVFDLGGVLIDWDPRYLYRQLMPTDEEVDAFLKEVDFDRWNHDLDTGRTTWAATVAGLVAAYPDRRELLEAYHPRFDETMSGPIDGALEVLRELHEQGVRLVALTNWSAETFPAARARFDFLDLFEGIVVSGDERVAKPDPEIFEILVRRHDLDPARTLYIDDKQANIEAAGTAGLVAVLFTDPARLRADLEAARVLLPRS